jgi:hypothetical protein
MQLNAKPLLVLLCVLPGACGRPTPPPRARASAPSPPPAAEVPEKPVAPVITPLPPPPTVGMEEPFARMKQASVDKLNEGYRALRKKKYSDARDAFHAVVAALPDHTGARFEELKAAAMEGDFAALPALWKELLQRDYVGYAEKLERPKDLAPLRASGAWKTMQAIKTEMKTAYASGLADKDKGFLFVARLRPHGAPTFAEYTDAAALALDQEVYHFDPTSKRIRRLSDTGGQVVAIHREGGKVMVLTARTLKKSDGGTTFSKPEATLVALDTLEKAGPIAIDGDARSVELCFSAKGEPVWTVNGAVETKALTLDATGSTLVTADEGCGTTLATTTATPTGVEHHRPDPEGVALSEDGLQVSGVDADKPVRASQAVRPGSLSWSPGKKRFAYTGSVDRCAKPADKKPAPNAVFVWDAGQKKATRVVSDPASYETQWLDDDHLAYESRTGSQAKLVLHDLGTGTALTLKIPAGAGLFGMPTVPCQQPSLALMQ